MKIYNFMKKVFSNDSEISNEHKNSDANINCQYPILLDKCSYIYAAMTRYEYCLCGIEGIAFDKEMYEKTKDKMFLESLEKNKHTIFIKPLIIKDLILCAKNSYKLNKLEFLKALEEIFVIVATNSDYTPKFCYYYFSKELERYIY